MRRRRRVPRTRREPRTRSNAKMTSQRRADWCSRPERKRSSTSWKSNPTGEEAFSNWFTSKRGETIKKRRRTEVRRGRKTKGDGYGGLKKFKKDEGWKATFCTARQHPKEGQLGRDLAGGAKLFFGLAFGSGYNGAFQNCGGPKASRGSYGRRRGTRDLRER